MTTTLVMMSVLVLVVMVMVVMFAFLGFLIPTAAATFCGLEESTELPRALPSIFIVAALVAVGA